MTLNGQRPLLMGHRGEKVFMPEHTVASYELASAEGAEFVEPDLTLTKDGELVCFHDLTLKSGTDVANHLEFRRKMRSFSGWLGHTFVNITDDWFIIDFTLEDLQTLHVKQKPTGIRLQYFNSLFPIPTFKEYLNIVHKMAHKLGKPIGIIPELKHPAFNNGPFGPHYMETKLLETLRAYGYPTEAMHTPACKHESEHIPCGDVIIQSFEQDSLQYLKGKTNRELMMLVDNDTPLLTYEGLKNISTFAAYYGVWKEHLFSGPEAVLIAGGKPIDIENVTKWGGFPSVKTFVDDAHKLGMKMSIYTIYDSREPSRRGCDVKCQPENKTEELFYYFEMGVDGLFVENIMEARELRLQFENQLGNGNGNDKSAGNSLRGFGGNQFMLLMTTALFGLRLYLGLIYN
jgi:glycerophosphoryl diester phosphodiesterase